MLLGYSDKRVDQEIGTFRLMEPSEEEDHLVVFGNPHLRERTGDRHAAEPLDVDAIGD